MKKLINSPEGVLEEMLEGFLILDPGLARLEGSPVLLRADADQVRDRQVALISGGGSGHEPAHAGYVGHGMLSAAVLGQVFTSPSGESVLAAIRAVAGLPGVLLIVKNYTGDRLNFGLAAELARAEGIPVEMVTVADDVALAASGDMDGARGLAGTILVHKVAGAAAAEGKSLDEVAAIARATAQAIVTMGLSLSAGTSPSTGRPSFVLSEDEIEMGLGIHGEPGLRRMSLQPADALVTMLLDHILSTAPGFTERFARRERIVLLVNGLGATTAMELAICARTAFRALGDRGFEVERLYSGTFLSSLDMAGISLSLMAVDEDRLHWLDALTAAPAWPKGPSERPHGIAQELRRSLPAASISQAGREAAPASISTFAHAITAACAALFEAEAILTQLDQAVGDGDLGVTLGRGARAVESALPTYPLSEVPATLQAIGRTLQANLGGASGPLYGVMFLRCGAALPASGPLLLEHWALALASIVEALTELGGARLGDRTMLDALIPFAKALANPSGQSTQETVLAAFAAAEQGAQATSTMLPRRGRSSYLGIRALGHPDPGAVALTLWLRAVVNALFAQPKAP